MSHPRFSLALGLSAGLATLFAPSCCAVRAQAAGLVPSPYLAVGVSSYETLTGGHDAFAYALGVDFPLNRWLSIDAGVADFGTAYEPKVGVGAIDTITPFLGSELRRRGNYVLASLHWRPSRRFEFSAGIGPAVVFSRTRSYSTLVVAPKVSTFAFDDARVEFFAKASAEFHVTDAWHVGIAAFGTESTGYSKVLIPSKTEFRAESFAVMLGLRYSGTRLLSKSDEAHWTLDLGPAVSRLSYHANYHGTLVGYDLALGRKFRRCLTIAFGHTELGQLNERPLYPDGTFLQTPPYHEGYPNGDLRVTANSTYATLGISHDFSGRLNLGAAAGPSRTAVSFLGVSPVYGPESRFIDIADKITLVGQAHAKWKLGGGWHAKLSVRYTEIQGTQITHPGFERDFGNTKVRILSFIPALSLSF